ncbi:hypothetical protein [Nodularia sp. NIES-3585]|uniref:hypothetical protein n=1 Tax=Nodularia sp. NIES-3585 TaxID=1973477 RepID=UPI000B63C2ED|nr:hypothetical protein [Nodularia sp. NIES-3585]GAX38336.1 hypothetical protein NIES3585_43850 [Nodularia sp. NIES-3585]
MSVQSIQSELLVELSTEEQQLLSGGRRGRGRRCPRTVIVPRCGPYFRDRGFGGGFDDDFDF